MAHRKKEVAKFLTGAEAFHTVTHVAFMASGTTLNIFGISFQPGWHVISAVINLLITVALASYAWGIFGRRAQRGEL